MPDTLEFSRPITFAQPSSEPIDCSIEATEEECAQLAHRFELLALKNLKANLTLEPGQEKGSFFLTGSFCADVVQACVLTLQDVQDHIAADLEVMLLPDVHKVFQGEEDADDDGYDYEPIVNDCVDLGEVIAQYVALSLNPYPRHPSAEFSDVASSKPDNPFQVLEGLKKR